MELNELDQAFENLLKDFPQARRKLVEDSGDKMYKKVIANIEANCDEETGDLKEGVEKHVGTGGGYSAVRPNWKKAPHTHLVENGRKRVKKGEIIGWIPGKHMYRNALNELVNELEQEAEKMLDELVGDF